MRPTLTATALANMIETGANQILNLDPAGRAQLLQHAGSSIELNIADPNLFCTVLVETECLRVTLQAGQADGAFDADSGANARVTGRAAALIAALAAPGPDDPPAFGLRIHGDEALVTALFNVARNLQPDLGGPLSSVLGPDVASMAQTAAATALRAGQEMVGTLAAAAANAGAKSTADPRPKATRFLSD